MLNLSKSAALAAALLLSCALPLALPAVAQDGAAPDEQTTAIVGAAQAFIDGLSDEQRQIALFSFEPQPTATAQSFSRDIFIGEVYSTGVWSNYPVSDVIRPGLRLGDLSEQQRAAAMTVLATVLSPEGYQKVIDIMDADQVLSDTGTPYDDGRDVFTLAIFGEPSGTSPWMIQFGGHHLGLNAVVVGPNVSLTPSLTGDQPASFERDGVTVRPLGDENDKAFALMNALTTEQQAKATLPYDIDNLVLGPGQDGKTLQPEGLSVAEMSADQKSQLMSLVAEWVGMLNDDDAAPKLAEIEANLDSSYFAWHGATTNPSSVYFRVTGPTVSIEFAHQGVGQGSGVEAGGINHIHTVYRDPTNNYGTAWTLPK